MGEGGIWAVFLANRALVRRLLLARTGNAADAEDIVQEMWLRIEQARIGPVADPLAYLMRMANNLATDRQTAARRRSTREAGWHSLQPVGAEHPDPERQLVSADEWARLNALLGSMPEAMHRALVMFRVDGMRQQAIAEELGMSVSGVEKLLARAYRRLVDFRNDSKAVAASSRAGGADGRSTSNG